MPVRPELPALVAGAERLACILDECEDVPVADRAQLVELARGIDRDAVIHRLGENGIACAPYLPSVHLQSYMRDRYGFREGLCPVSEDASERTMAIPFHARLAREDQERVAEALRSALQ